MTTTTEAEYFTFTAPLLTLGSLTVNVQSSGLSLLSPDLTVYAADQHTVLGSASGLGQYGTTLSVTLNNVMWGEQFYVKVTGADTTAFSTGAYGLSLSFGLLPPPIIAPPNTMLLDGTPLQGSGGVPMLPAPGDTYLASVPVVTGISPDNGASSDDGVTDANRLIVNGTAPAGETVNVYLANGNGGNTLLGTTVANANNLWSFNYTGTALADGTYYFSATATDVNGFTSGSSTPYMVVIDTTPPAKPAVTGITPLTGFNATGVITNVNLPTVIGTAAAYSTVTVYLNGQAYGTTAATSSGAWSFTPAGTLADGAYTITATATDLAGNVSAASAAFTVTIDTHAPAPGD